MTIRFLHVGYKNQIYEFVVKEGDYRTKSHITLNNTEHIVKKKYNCQLSIRLAFKPKKCVISEGLHKCCKTCKCTYQHVKRFNYESTNI